MKYLVFLATEAIEVEADLVRKENNYFTPTIGQQPTICFYRGTNPTRDHVIAEFVVKNISGYCKAGEVIRRQLPEGNTLLPDQRGSHAARTKS